jgi:hypothetical protein
MDNDTMRTNPTNPILNGAFALLDGFNPRESPSLQVANALWSSIVSPDLVRFDARHFCCQQWNRFVKLKPNGTSLLLNINRIIMQPSLDRCCGVLRKSKV